MCAAGWEAERLLQRASADPHDSGRIAAEEALLELAEAQSAPAL